MKSTKPQYHIKLPQTLFIGWIALVCPLIWSSRTLDPDLPIRFIILAAVVLLFGLVTPAVRSSHKLWQQTSIWNSPLIWLQIGYVVIAGLSLTRTINLTEGIFDWLKLTLGTLLFIWTTVVIKAYPDTPRRMSGIFMFSSAMMCIIGLDQYYRIGLTNVPGDTAFVPFSTMANRNLFASALLLILPFQLIGILTYSTAWLYLAYPVFGLNIFVIGIAQSRSVWLALFIAAALLTVLLWRQFRAELFPTKAVRHLKKRLQHVCIISLIAVAAIPAFQSKNDPTSVVARAATIITLNERAINERFTLWKKTLHMVGDKDNLWRGVGLAQWKLWMPTYGVEHMRSEFGTVHFLQPHNDFLWVLAETGLFGLICYLGFFGYGLYAAGQALQKTNEPLAKLTVTLMLCGFISYMIDANFSFPHERIFHTVMLMTYGAFFAATNPSEKSSIIHVYADKILIIFSIIMGLAGFTIGFIRYQAETHTLKALLARDRADWAEVIVEINAAESPFYTLDTASTPLVWYRGVAHFTLGQLEPALIDFKTAYRYHPYHLHALNNLATCHELSGHHAEATQLYRQAIALSPHFEDALLNLATIYYNTGHYQDALNLINQTPAFSRNLKIKEYRQVVEAKLKESVQSAIDNDGGN